MKTETIILNEERNVTLTAYIQETEGEFGFSTGEDWINTNSVCPRLPHWVEDSVEWLGEVIGKLTRNGFTEPTAAISMNADFAPILGIECSLRHIRKQDDEVQIVLAPMFEGIEAVAKERGFQADRLMEAIGSNTVREIMELCQIPAETIGEIDTRLHGMVNKLEV